MGVARHYGFGVLFCNIYNSVYKLTDKLCYFIDFILEIKLYIKSHLIVSAPCGVQTLSRIAYSCGKLSLNEHMNIFRIGIEMQCSVFNIA